jgi:hypothetical protein
LGAQALDRINVQNNPVNFIDPWGLFDALANPGAYLGTAANSSANWSSFPGYKPKNPHPNVPELTTGRKVAILKTTGGASAIVAGALLGQPEVIAGGIVITADGFALSLAELIGGDTSSIPSDYELARQIFSGIIDNWPNNDSQCK